MQDVPSLKTSEGRLLASGKDQIRQKIAALNDGVRDDGHQVRAAIVFIIMLLSANLVKYKLLLLTVKQNFACNYKKNLVASATPLHTYESGTVHFSVW